jgi:hypothetical protein
LRQAIISINDALPLGEKIHPYQQGKNENAPEHRFGVRMHKLTHFIGFCKAMT